MFVALTFLMHELLEVVYKPVLIVCIDECIIRSSSRLLMGQSGGFQVDRAELSESRFCNAAAYPSIPADEALFAVV